MDDSRNTVDLERIKQQVEAVKKILTSIEGRRARDKKLKEKVRMRKKYGRHAAD